jgi:hypothetical protein
MFPLDFRKRVMIVVNKWWECDPVMNVLLHAKARPPELGWPDSLHHPRPRPADRAFPPGQPSVRPRAAWTLRNTVVEVWCISDLLEQLPDQNRFQSSSARKVEALPLAFAGRAPALVVAVGTAGYPIESEEEPGINGGVTAGTRVFIHDFHPKGDENPDSRWHDGPFDQLLDATLDQKGFDGLFAFDRDEALKRFVRPPNRPVDPVLLADAGNASVGAVNVTNYAEYEQSDKAALEAFAKLGSASPPVSMETTHGLIRLAAGKAPFLFVSGIPDRVGHFKEEVDPNEYAQNFAASHNVGVVVAWMVPRIDALFGGGA